MKTRLIYQGKRLVHDKLYQQFLTPDGKEVYFSGISRVYIGDSYEGSGSKPGDVKLSRRPSRWPHEVEPHPDEDLWRAQERAAVTEWRAENLKKRAEKLPGLLGEISLIKKFAKGLSWSERRSFVEWILDEVTREEREKLTRETNASLVRMRSSFGRTIKKLNTQIEKQKGKK